MRRLLSDLLSSSPEIEVVGTARERPRGGAAGRAAQAGRDHARRRDAGGLGPGGTADLAGRARGAGRHGQRADAGGRRRDLAGPGAGRVRLHAQARAEPARRNARQPRPAGRQGAGGRAEPRPPSAAGRLAAANEAAVIGVVLDLTPWPEQTELETRPGIVIGERRRRQPMARCASSSASRPAARRRLSQIFPQLVPAAAADPGRPAHAGAIHRRLRRSGSIVTCALTVKQAEEGDLVLPDQVLIAPGGRHMALAGHPPRVRVALSDDPPVSGHRPSIDVLFQSAAKVYHSAVDRPVDDRHGPRRRRGLQGHPRRRRVHPRPGRGHAPSSTA